MTAYTLSITDSFSANDILRISHFLPNILWVAFSVFLSAILPAMAFLLARVVWAGIQGHLYTAIDVNRNVDSGLGISLSHLIARYINTDVPFSHEDRALLAKIRPENKWPYNYYMESTLFHDANMAPILLTMAPLTLLTISESYRFVSSNTLVSSRLSMPFLLSFLRASQETRLIS